MSAFPSAMLLAHLKILGRYCPGHRCPGHPAEGLTARTGQVLCGECSSTLESERKEPA